MDVWKVDRTEECDYTRPFESLSMRTPIAAVSLLCEKTLKILAA
jgi:hypothetical protein